MSEDKTKKTTPELSHDEFWEKFMTAVKKINAAVSEIITDRDKFGFKHRFVVVNGESWERHSQRAMGYYWMLTDPIHLADAKYNFELRGDNTEKNAEKLAEDFLGYVSRPERLAEPSTESLGDPEMKKRRAVIENMIYETVQKMDPSGDNTNRWKKIFGAMNDTQFGEFMEHLRKKECQLNIVMPNMKKTPKIPDLLEAAKYVGLELSHRLWLPDKTRPGKKFLTNEKYLVLEIPVRRAQQEWDKKLQVPSRDTHIDALTGQVILDDRACHLSMPEIQALSTRRLDKTLAEFIKIRGGDVMAYGDFKRQLEESGEARSESLDPRTRARAATMSHILLQSMMIDNNL